jgi:acyl-CoA synthetase (AMP-forming)/AMP-acid ligase II
MWLSQILDRNRLCFGGRAAIIDGRETLTWADLDDRVRAMGGRLLELGLRPGDRVVVIAEETARTIEVFFALAGIGVAFVPVNPGLTVAEVADIMHRSRAAAVIGDDGRLARLRVPELSAVKQLDGQWLESLGPARGPGRLPQVRPDDIAAIMHTSATAGWPKGVAWDHRGLMQVGLGWLTAAAPSGHIVLLNCVPLSHPGVAMCLTYMAAAATVVVLPHLTPGRALEAVERYGVTHLWLVPETLRALASATVTGHHDLSSLREIIYGGAPMSWDAYQKARRVFACGFRQAYGTAEAGGHVAMLAPDEHPTARGPGGPGLPVGRVLPGVSVQIRDEAGHELGPGAIGQILIRSDSLMRGYWDDPSATAKVIRDGWLRTGDLGAIDDAGHIHLAGRLTDVIITDGLKVYPAEVERVLRDHPAVRDVAVVGRPDLSHGEVPVAFVVPEPGPAPTAGQLSELAQARLATYKRPALITILGELPLDPMGQVLKRILQEKTDQTR